MTIRVKLFAVIREKAGQSELTLDLPAASTVHDAVAALGRRHPAVEKYLRRSAFAVNQAYVPASTVMNDNDELAIIPPVSGG